MIMTSHWVLVWGKLSVSIYVYMNGQRVVTPDEWATSVTIVLIWRTGQVVKYGVYDPEREETTYHTGQTEWNRTPFMILRHQKQSYSLYKENYVQQILIITDPAQVVLVGAAIGATYSEHLYYNKVYPYSKTFGSTVDTNRENRDTIPSIGL